MNRLQSAAGFSYYEAKVLYGVYGKAQTLFNLPARSSLRSLSP